MSNLNDEDKIKKEESKIPKKEEKKELTVEEKIPGFPAKQSISRPESSDKVVKCDLLQKKSAFISEF